MAVSTRIQKGSYGLEEKAYTGVDRSDLVVAASTAVVTGTLPVDNTGCGAGGAALKVGRVEVNHLWRDAHGSGGRELGREKDHDRVEKHLDDCFRFCPGWIADLEEARLYIAVLG